MSEYMEGKIFIHCAYFFSSPTSIDGIFGGINKMVQPQNDEIISIYIS
ncbi:MAG: hypothetical protein HN829_08660 [Candidatus Marinimicrobia bacterium]|nr:hypothetical protein [Candidatus Neomarinimicrobiota bacterium]